MNLTKPLLIDPELLAPLPQALQGAACKHCNRPQARWRLAMIRKIEGNSGAEFIQGDVDDYEPMCAVCFLYDSHWGKQRRKDIDLLIMDIEHERKQPYLVDGSGRLTPPAADEVLAAIALTSKMFAIQDRLQEQTAKS